MTGGRIVGIVGIVIGIVLLIIYFFVNDFILIALGSGFCMLCGIILVIVSFGNRRKSLEEHLKDT